MTEHMAAYKYDIVVLIIIPSYKYVVTIVWILQILYTIFIIMINDIYLSITNITDY